MNQTALLKNIPLSQPLTLADLVDYQEGRVVSRTLCQNEALSLTLFAFDRGEGLSAHSVAADALALVLDGQALVTIGGREMTVRTGEVVAMPQGVSHALAAEERFKMFLVVVNEAA